MDKNKLKAAGLLILLSIIWGSSFILMKKGLVAYTYYEVSSLRILISAIVFLPFVFKNFSKINPKKLFLLFFFALIEIGLPPFLFTYAQQYVNSSTAGILNSLTPIFTMLTGAVIYKLKFNYSKVTGVIIGLIGAVLLVIFKSAGSFNLEISSAWGGLIVIATLFYGIAGNMLKEDFKGMKGLEIMSISFFMMGIPALSILIFSGFSFTSVLQPQYINSFLAVTTLSIFGSALSLVLLAVLIGKSNALFASFITYLIPFVALMWGWLDGEGISYLQVLSLLLILGGILLASRKDFKKKASIDKKIEYSAK